MKTLPKSHMRRGSFLLVAVLVAFALTSLVGTFIALSTTSVKTTEANFTHHATLNPGEEALDISYGALRRYMEVLTNGTDVPQPGKQSAADDVFSAARGWTTSGSSGAVFSATRLVNNGSDIALGNRRSASGVRVTIRNIPRAVAVPSPSRPDILAEVTYAPSNVLGGSGYTRQFYAQLDFTSTGATAMLARNLLTLNGKVSVDSFDAKLGIPSGNPGPSTSNCRDNATIACTIDAIGVDGGTALIYGYAATQSLLKSDISFKGSAHVWGDYLNQGTGGESANIEQDDYPGWDADGGTLLNSGVDQHRLKSGFDVDPSLEINQVYNKDNISNDNELQSDDQLLTPVNGVRLAADPVDGVMTLTLDATDPVTGKNIGGYYVLPPAGLTVGSGAPQQRVIIKGAVKIIASDLGAEARLAGVTGRESETVTSADTLPSILVKAGGEIRIPPLTTLADGTKVRNTLAIFSAGNIDASGGSIVNDASFDGTRSSATAFTIYGTNKNSGAGKKVQSIVMGGSSNNIVNIRAPFANVTMTGTSGTMIGAVLAYNITTNGSIAFHYDEALSNTGRIIPILKNWMELKGASKVDFTDFR